MGLSVWGFHRWKKTPAGRQAWDRFKLRAPGGIGKVVLKVTMARFSRTLATLVAAGVDIMKALEISGQTAGNWVVESALVDVRGQGAPGRADRTASDREPGLPPLVSQMVRVGEETGELEKMLDKIADFYEDEVDTVDRVAHIDHRAAHDDRHRRDHRDHRDLDVPADVQDAAARAVDAP